MHSGVEIKSLDDAQFWILGAAQRLYMIQHKKCVSLVSTHAGNLFLSRYLGHFWSIVEPFLTKIGRLGPSRCYLCNFVNTKRCLLGIHIFDGNKTFDAMHLWCGDSLF